jgi:ATP sulfurylase
MLEDLGHEVFTADGLLANLIAGRTKEMDGEAIARKSMWDTMLVEGTVPKSKQLDFANRTKRAESRGSERNRRFGEK